MQYVMHDWGQSNASSQKLIHVKTYTLRVDKNRKFSVLAVFSFAVKTSRPFTCVCIALLFSTVQGTDGPSVGFNVHQPTLESCNCIM